MERETVKIEEVARRLNRGLDTIKAGLIQGRFPFGVAYRDEDKNSDYAYIIPREAFENWMKYGNANITNQILIPEEQFDNLAKILIAR